MIVIDTSVALKLIVDEPERAGVPELAASDQGFIAPDLMLIEAATALWRKVREADLPRRDADEALTLLPRLFEAVVPSRDLLGRAYELAHDLGHPVPDCLFLALAERADTVVVTADKKFVARVARSSHVGRVRLLAA